MKQERRRRRWLVGITIVLVLLVAGGWLAHRALQARKHPGLPTFIGQLFTNYPSSFAVEPLVLRMTIAEDEMATLRDVVETARERGVILPEGRPYVAAALESEAGRFKAKVRIKGKMTDHVQGAKWSFRVVAKKDGGFLGMQRFSLQHPGTRNYLCEWLAQRLMAGEGIISLRYGFIHLFLNDEDLGIYAYEEHFGPELLEHNGRMPGPLFRFDPALFWEHRLNEMRQLRFDEPYAAYQAAALDAFDSGELAKDSVARSRFEEAVALMDAFRRGKLPASQVFDADRIARRHALLDLVGGHHSMDWSDVKFYYDPVLKRIEPVAYESFSAYSIRNLAGSGRWVGRTDPAMDLHDAYFNDETIFRAYVHHLERVSRDSYLDSAFTVLGPGLDSASATIYREFPWKELDRDIYRRNQRVIRSLLNTPKGFHAYTQDLRRDTLTVMAVPVDGLPMEVHGLLARDGSLIPPAGLSIVPCRKAGHVGAPVMLRFAVRDTAQLPEPKDRRLAYSVLGASVHKELELFPYALLQDLPVLQAPHETTDLKSIPFVQVDEATRTIGLRSGRWMLDRDLVLPMGYTVQATAPFQLELRNGARFTSRSPVQLSGLPDAPIRITGDGAIMLLETGAPSRWEHVEFMFTGGTGPALVVQAASVEGRDLTIVGEPTRDLLLVVRSQATLSNVQLRGGKDQLTLAFADARLRGVEAVGAADDAMVLRGGQLDAQHLVVLKAGGGAVALGSAASALLADTELQCGGKGVEVEEGSSLKWEGGSITCGGIGVDVRKLEMRYGPSSVELVNVQIQAEKTPLRCGEGSTLTVDGKPFILTSTSVEP